MQKSRGFAIVELLVVVTILTILVGGILIWKGSPPEPISTPLPTATSTPTSTPIPSPSPSPSPSPTLIPSPSPTPVPSPSPLPDPTADWLTYSSETTCYTFKYPKEVTLQTITQESTIHLSFWGPTQKSETEFFDGISLNLSFPLKIGSISLKEYADSKIEESKQHGEVIKPREVIIVNGISGYTYTVEGLGTFQNIYLQPSDKSCTVEITNSTKDPTNQGYQQTVDNILSTFKFVK